ncbi:acetyl-CoA carboxylase biotin carboxyl carrier protein subunit [Prauserella marina]|uniref:Acyl-CoA carboxylase epsilon subunit n=1 Tax=Prauserella marina TaxID=530584 RepID=A0A222VK40_9PSEU|nr:acyl-CoA carboxylase subunit epsilon [Prauserella marina]ASR34254.1 acetyl-CoA carboxylase biotin carboxyl carrier protein subunit [Prauserella marina]PWV71980.1 acyl-CoA carboxylase epsilon subunit-like protein [Prauserella marina]SDD92409.1 Acyl-CoA carboxylase epsilon subunit [Prauserella marina]
MSAGEESERKPFLRVVRGKPDDTELAALAAVVAGMAASGAAEEPAAPRPRSRWADRATLVRSPLRPGQGAWRASALPR